MVEWRPVYGFSFYEISSDGQVRRCRQFPHNKQACTLGKVIKPRAGGYKRLYHRVGLTPDDMSRRVDRYIHRLMLESFVGPAPSKSHQASHLDGNPSNNTIDNLVWESPIENSRRKLGHGTSGRGSANPMAKLTEDQVKLILQMYLDGKTPREIKNELNLDATVMHVVRRDAWKHVELTPEEEVARRKRAHENVRLASRRANDDRRKRSADREDQGIRV